MRGVSGSNGDCGRGTRWRVREGVGNFGGGGGGKEDDDRMTARGDDKVSGGGVEIRGRQEGEDRKPW